MRQQEFDPKRRLKLLQEIMRVYHEDAVMLYIAETVNVDGLSKRVRGYEPVNRIINYHQIRLVDEIPGRVVSECNVDRKW